MRAMRSAIPVLLLCFLGMSPVLAGDVEDGEPNFKVHGGVRARGEYSSNGHDFDDDGGFYDPDIPILIEDDAFGYLPLRVRLAVEGMFPKDVSAWIEFQYADVFGASEEQRDVVVSNNDPLDLYQGYLQLKAIGGSAVFLRVGRQEVKYDEQFLLGNLEFYNGVSHDGVTFGWELARGRVDIFFLKENETFRSDADTDLVGAHTSWNIIPGGGDVGGYLLYLRDDQVSGTNRRDLYTLGLRSGRHVRGANGFLWNAEIAFQSGTVGNILDPVTGVTGDDLSISAFGGEGQFGYNWAVGGKDHQASARFYYATGDSDPADDTVEAFDPLFQDFHRRLGVGDYVRGTNIASVSIAYHLRAGQHRFAAEYFRFVLNEPTQASDPNGIVTPVQVGHGPNSVLGRFDGLAVTPNSQGEDDLGGEIDLLYDFEYSKHLSFGFGLALFQPGAAIELANSGKGDPATRIWGQAKLTF